MAAGMFRRWGLAALFVVVPVGIRYLLSPILTTLPFSACFVAVTLAARFCGVGGTLLAFVASFLACDYLFMSPRGSVLVFGTLAEAVQVLVSAGIAALLGGLMLAAERAKERLAVRESMLAQKERALRQLLRVQEREKQEFGHDLHDGVLQYVIAAKMMLQSAAGRPDDRAAGDALDTAADHLERAIGEARSLVRGMRTAPLDDLGLGAAIEDLIEQSTGEGCRVEATIADDLADVPTELQVVVYRVVQELLANVRKHAPGARVTLAVRRLAGTLEVVATDDGCGFDVTAVEQRGFGLVGIRERVAMVRGECRVESGPGRGTRVVVRVPLPVGPNRGAAASGRQAPDGAGEQAAVAGSPR